MKFIGDLFEDRKLMSWEKFKEKYDVPCIRFEYENLLQSLPSYLKNVQPCLWYQQPALPARLQYLLNNTTFTRLFTRGRIENRRGFQSDINRIESKWIRDIGTFESLSVLNVKKSVSASRYTSFQFKLVMRILTTNTFLSLIKVQENDLCIFCQEDRETLSHLFLTCGCVGKFWDEIDQFLSRQGIGPPNRNTKIFGDKDNALVTHVVTVAKYTIYDARRRNIRPCFRFFKELLMRDFDSERYIARKKQKDEDFREKWKALWREITPDLNSGIGTE